MDPKTARAHVLDCIKGDIHLFGTSSPGARVLELPGVSASVAPSAPDRSLFNAVAYDDCDALLRAYDQLAHAYQKAGVRAWTVWVQASDSAAQQALAVRGHLLDSSPIGMAAMLAELELPPPGDLDWSRTDDFALVASLNDRAFGLPPPAFAAVLAHVPVPEWRLYVARVTGQAAACVMVHDGADGDAGVTGVATLAEARGAGLASRLLSAGLREAQSRGLLSTTLVASSKGRGVYARLGYKEVGAVEMWERRRGA